MMNYILDESIDAFLKIDPLRFGHWYSFIVSKVTTAIMDQKVKFGCHYETMKTFFNFAITDQQ
jgi:hypothetical protein